MQGFFAKVVDNSARAFARQNKMLFHRATLRSAPRSFISARWANPDTIDCVKSMKP